MGLRRFTPQEDAFICENLKKMSLTEIGENLGRHSGSIHGRMKRLGLSLPEDVKRKRIEESTKRVLEVGKNSRFPKGHTPANKGKKMEPETYQKCKPTMFKKGQLPANTKHFGKPYLHTRTTKTGNTEKTWYIQESTNKRSAYMTYLCRKEGINMKGKKPRLKPGFDHSRPPTLDDIDIISNRKNMQLNSFYRYPEPVRKLVQIKGVLTRQINKEKKS